MEHTIKTLAKQGQQKKNKKEEKKNDDAPTTPIRMAVH